MVSYIGDVTSNFVQQKVGEETPSVPLVTSSESVRSSAIPRFQTIFAASLVVANYSFAKSLLHPDTRSRDYAIPVLHPAI